MRDRVIDVAIIVFGLCAAYFTARMAANGWSVNFTTTLHWIGCLFTVWFLFNER